VELVLNELESAEPQESFRQIVVWIPPLERFERHPLPLMVKLSLGRTAEVIPDRWPLMPEMEAVPVIVKGADARSSETFAELSVSAAVRKSVLESLT
jgi:hypothetical protein